MSRRKNSKFLSQPVKAEQPLTLVENWITAVEDSGVRYLLHKHRNLAPGNFPHVKSLREFMMKARIDDAVIEYWLETLWASWKHYNDMVRHSAEMRAVHPPRALPIKRPKIKWLSR